MPQNPMNTDTNHAIPRTEDADTDNQMISSNDADILAQPSGGNNADIYDLLTGALIGLVRVCNHKARTERSDRLILKGLSLLSGTSSGIRSETSPNVGATTVPGDEFLPSSPAGLTDVIHAEKNIISPGCAVCASPCGGTFDYDMSELYRDPDSNIRSLKILLLFTTEGIAADILRNINAESIDLMRHDDPQANDLLRYGDSESNALLRYEEPIIFLYRALMAIGDTCDMDDLLMLMMEAGDLHISLR